jgi:hypothetical protein
MSTAPTKPDNGSPPPDAKARVKFLKATDDPAPELPVKVRPSRDGETWPDRIAAATKEAGVIDHSARLTAATKQQIAEEVLRRAHEDELFGGSRAGRIILAADAEWRARNPEIKDVGELSGVSKDLLGRAVRGPARAVALVLETLTEDPTATLTPAETELLRSLAPEVVEAIGSYEQAIAELREGVLAAVNASQLAYPPGEPGPAVDRSELQEAKAS